MSIKIKIKNCKSIKNGEIIINENILNVKYAANGIGKSTIADALTFFIGEKEIDLKNLKTFGENDDPNVEIFKINDDGTENISTDYFKHVEIFNDDFVNNIIFKGNEAIIESFEVFIKTPDFEEKRKLLNEKLIGLKFDIDKDENIKKMQGVFDVIETSIKINANGGIKKIGMVKDIINKNNIHNLPSELKKFEEFFLSDNRVGWVDWKSNGHNFDDKYKCPFCTNTLIKDEYDKEKNIFQTTYNKSMIKNQQDLEKYLISLKPFMNEIDFNRLLGYTKEIANEKDFEKDFLMFREEIIFVNRKINEAKRFDTHDVKKEEIPELDKKIKGLLIDIRGVKIFNSDDSIKVFDFVNQKIIKLLGDIENFQNETDMLNSLINKTIEDSKNDINNFLKSAGISYEFGLVLSDEKTLKTKLKYVDGADDNKKDYEVPEIRKSLSWGEKNCIALVLFLYWALQKNADLIILDDPISSFDKNKKYAIMSRLFDEKQKKHFFKKTVLFLTHDFEPIIDLKVKKRFIKKLARADYLTNLEGHLEETEINSEEDVKSITVMYLADLRNENLGIINKVASLRKLMEYMNGDYKNNYAYNILSSLMKGRKKATININKKPIDLIGIQFREGEDIIKEDIQDFDYESLLKTEFTKERIKELFNKEDNNYFKVQIFRQFFILENNLEKIEDEILKKFVDESYHIENDYTHCLDYNKFDIVPPYIMNKINEYMKTK